MLNPVRYGDPVDANQETAVCLRGRLLGAARLMWLVLAVLALGTFIISIPGYYHQQFYRMIWMEQNSPIQSGAAMPFYFGYVIGLDVITVLTFAAVAAGIVLRRSQEWMTILLSTALLTFGVAITFTIDEFAPTQPLLQLTIGIVRMVGMGLLLVVFYVFPDGRFVPRWSRWLAMGWIGWMLAWTVFPPALFEPEQMPMPLRTIAFMLSIDTATFDAVLHFLRVSSLVMVIMAWFGSGVFAQVYRYTHVSTPVQRQQTKWVVTGVVLAFVGYFGNQLFRLFVPYLDLDPTALTISTVTGITLSTVLMLLVPLSIRTSMLHRRLWAIDPLIQRTLVYGTLTGALAILYFGSVFIFQRIFRQFTALQSDIVVVILTLIIAGLFQPLRRRVQNFIDRRFYREKVDFRRAFTSFSREIRTIIDLPELLRVLIDRTTRLLHIHHSAVFLRNADRMFELVEARNLSADEAQLTLETHTLAQLQSGHAIPRPTHRLFPLLVPLIAPRAEGSQLVGVLALGPRLSGQDYTREDQALLTGLADQAGTAIYVARLIQEYQAEAHRREEIEHRLEMHRNSPIGRAETFAQTLLYQPETTLVELHRLAQAASQDPNAAAMLDHLPRVLDTVGATPLAELAEAFHYLYDSQSAPEMLPVALRTLVAQLERYPTEGIQYVCRWQPGMPPPDEVSACNAPPLLHAAEALITYRLCQTVLEANSITEITELMHVLEQQPSAPNGLLHDLQASLDGVRQVAEALHAYERLDTSRDKLAYLASAVERLRRVDYLARSELGSADRAIVQRIAERWLNIVTGAMSELQTRSQLVCQLLTRHTWQGDVVPLVLNLRNDGRGAALNLRITLTPSGEYSLLEDVAHLERLGQGEEARVELRVRPHLAEGADYFRARFVIIYTDPRGPDQVEHFADVVHLLGAEGEFQYIPNPYVVGTPLDGGSPLFFGREDLVTYIQQNLSASHQNNLVLIGQRRTGKTSLLKQFPLRLGDNYLPVYLDGQALGLDPGLPNFFLALATEIAFALEDRGFDVPPPEYQDLLDSPAAFFEREFLVNVRRAIGARHLLIMFDEFEELETAARRGNLDPSVFGFLRHLIQHSERLSVIFCGTHRLEELASDYWNVLFNISLYRHIGFLEQDEALRLVQEPVAVYGMRYDDLALDKIWRVTAGHPYFLQLLCHSLVNHHNRTQRNYVTVADVNAALDEILASGEAHFLYLWTEATTEERLVLAALSRMIPLTGQATLPQVMDYLAERGVELERRAFSDALHRLTLRDVLSAGNDLDPTLGEVYRWRMGLLGLWVEKFKSLNRVLDEIRG